MYLDKNDPKIRRLKHSLPAELLTSKAPDCRKKKEKERRGGSICVWECVGEKWKDKENNMLENAEETAISFKTKQVDKKQNIKKCGENGGNNERK